MKPFKLAVGDLKITQSPPMSFVEEKYEPDQNKETGETYAGRNKTVGRRC